MANKKKGQTDYLSGKNLNILFIVVIVVLLIIIAFMFFIKTNSTESEVNEEANDDSSYTTTKTITGDYCKDNVIPEMMVFKTLMKEVTDGPRDYDDILSTWRDGTPIQILPVRDERKIVKCRIGDPNSGENPTYFYCDNLYYVKTIVNSNGADGETKAYLVDVVLDRTQYEVMHNHPPGWVGLQELKVTNKVVEGSCEPA